MVVLSIIAIIISICSLWGCIEKTMDLQRQIDELKAGFLSTGAMPQKFDKSFFEKGEDQMMPGAPPEDTIVVGDDIAARKAAVLHFYKNADYDHFPPGERGWNTEEELEQFLRTGQRIDVLKGKDGVEYKTSSPPPKPPKKRVTENKATTETRNG